MPIVTTAELAEQHGVTRQRIHQWHLEGLPKLARGKWDEDLCAAWIQERRTLGQEALPSESREHKSAADLRDQMWKLRSAQTEGVNLRNAKDRGELFPIETATRMQQAVHVTLVQRGDNWVSRGRNAEEIALRQEIWNELRGDISRSLESLAADFRRSQAVEPAEISDARSVG